MDNQLLERLKNTTIEQVMNDNGLKDWEEVEAIEKKLGLDIDAIIHSIQAFAFEDTVLAYRLGVAIASRKGLKTAEEIALALGEGLQAMCINGSVADIRKIGIGHGRLASRLLSEDTKCFCFLAGHESFAASEGAMSVATSANKVRKSPLKVILNGMGKDAGYIIARINGFTFVNTVYDMEKSELNIVGEKCFGSNGNIRIYGCDTVEEGVAIMKHESVDISITGNSTNPVRFTHPVAGIYKKFCYENGIKYFSVASGGGTGRTLHPDNMGAGPGSYGLTDTMGKMHCDVQFAGSSSVPAHVEMMGFVGMGNNPLVGATVRIAVALSQIINK